MSRPIRAALAAAKVDLPVVLARGPSGRVRELVKRADVEKALEKRSARSKAQSAAQKSADEARAREQKRAREAVAKRRAILAGFHAKPAAEWAQGQKVAEGAFLVLVRALVLETGSETLTELQRAYGVAPSDRARFEKSLVDQATGKGSSVTAAVRVGLEIALASALVRARWTGGTTLAQCELVVDEVLQLAGLDRKNLEAQGSDVVRRAVAKTQAREKASAKSAKRTRKTP